MIARVFMIFFNFFLYQEMWGLSKLRRSKKIVRKEIVSLGFDEWRN